MAYKDQGSNLALSLKSQLLPQLIIEYMIFLGEECTVVGSSSTYVVVACPNYTCLLLVVCAIIFTGEKERETPCVQSEVQMRSV